MPEKRKPKRNKSEKKLKDSTRIFLHTQLLALVVYALFFLLTSAVLLSLDIDSDKIFYVGIAAFALSSFICGYYAGYKVHKNGLLTGLLYALPANLLIIIVSAAVSGFKADFTLLISFMILLICSMLGGILSVNTRIKPKRK